MDERAAARERARLRITCADAVALMGEKLEDALGPEDADRLRAHLDGCEACAVYLDQLRATIEVTATTRAPRASWNVPRERLDALTEAFRRAHGGD